MKTLPFKILLLLLYLEASCFSYCQTSNFSLGALELKSTGNKSALLSKAAIGKMSFHATVGGISFEQVATPDYSLKNEAINVAYTANRPDGSRLGIVYNEGLDTVYTNLPDWQLIPIANYSNDTNNAIFTLLGARDSLGSSPIQYHSAFQNTLLGLRMLQADLLFSGYGGAYLSDLPTDSTGKALIGESEHTLHSRTADSVSYEDLLERVYDNVPPFSSYVFTDWGTEVKFGVANGQFYLSGEPYYLFTSKKTASGCKHYQKICSHTGTWERCAISARHSLQNHRAVSQQAFIPKIRH